MKGESIREKLHNGERVVGTCITQEGGTVTMTRCAALDLDFVFIDTEHTPLDRSEVSRMCRFLSAYGISPIVRISHPCGHLARMAMDGGADGIVAPYVETVEEVKELTGAVLYRPIKGKFLQEILDGKRELNPKMRDYLREFNRNAYLIIGIESVTAYERLDSLVAVNGVDGVFIGPHDLTLSMEIPEEYFHADYLRVVTDIIRRSRMAGKGVGLHQFEKNIQPEVTRRFIGAGMNWILHSTDLNVMTTAMARQLSELRSLKLE
jgi:4-hydroxy-2-oxoheptanedioate aldolase